MNFRKLFGMPSKAQTEQINVDVDVILDRCSKIADKENNEQFEMKKSHDGKCPHCKNTVDIVNRISYVHGKGNINGNLFGVSGYGEIDTDVVRHCNKCGNEWKVFKTKYVSRTEILRLALNYYGQILNDPKQKEYRWKVETIKVFDGCCAEAINNLRLANKDYLHSEAKSLTLSRLRKLHGSVYDKKDRKNEIQ